MNLQLNTIMKVLLSLALGVGLFLGFDNLFNSKDSKSGFLKNTDSTSTNFSYAPPEPINGTLKGVVELGASGFNYFIVRIDKSKNWKLEKADYGNSLVLEHMATDLDIRAGLKEYIGKMLDYGVDGKQIHFVVSSGAIKEEATQKIVQNLKAIGYNVNTVTPEQEGALALNCVLPKDYEGEAFVVDIGSSNTKVSWKAGKAINALETYGSKYYKDKKDDGIVYNEVKEKCKGIPTLHRKTCFIIGGVPFKMADSVRVEKERFTLLKDPDFYKFENAKEKSGTNIYKAIKDATQCKQFVFDWDSNFTIGYLLSLN